MSYKTYEIKCRFCPTVTGSITFEDRFDPGKLPNDIPDSRCDIHEAQHGNYRQMEIDYKVKYPDGDFGAFMKKTGYRRDNFDKEIDKQGV